jgi:PAS domain S-box-containing protein
MNGSHKSFPHLPQDFQSLYQNTPMMMHSIDVNGSLLSVSNSWLEKLEYSRDEVIGYKLCLLQK